MFCTNCGNNIENDSVFCTHCGQKVGSGAKAVGVKNADIATSLKDVWGFIVSLVKKPMDTMANLNVLSDMSTWLLGGIVTLVTVIEFFMLKSIVISKLISGISKATNSMNPYGNVYGSNYGAEMASEMFKGQNVKLFFGFVIITMLFLASGALVIFLASKFVFKKDDYRYVEGVKVMTSAYTYTAVIILIGIVLSVVSITLGGVMLGVSGVVNLILIYKGIASQGNCDENKALYLAVLTLMVNTLVQYTAMNILIKSVVKSMFGGMNF